MAKILVYCVYFNPADYPEKYVVREWHGVDPNPTPLIVSDCLEECRAKILQELPLAVMQPRRADDDAVIFETWM